MLGLEIAGLGTSLLGGLFGGISARRQARKAEKQIRRKQETLTREYAHDKNTDYLDTDAARSTLALLRRQNKRQMEALDNNAVKAGTSDEAKVAAAGRLNDSYAAAVSQIAGMGTEYKQRLKENYQNRMDSLDNTLYNVQMGKAQAANDMIGATSQAVGGFLTAYGLNSNRTKSIADTKVGRAAAAKSAASRNRIIGTLGKVAPPTPTLNVPTLSTAGIGMNDLTRRKPQL